MLTKRASPSGPVRYRCGLWNVNEPEPDTFIGYPTRVVKATELLHPRNLLHGMSLSAERIFLLVQSMKQLGF